MRNPFKPKPVDLANATMIEVAYVKTGSMLKAARVVAFIQAWGVTRRELGREPTADEYAERWGEDRSTVYRSLALFRSVFDRCESPSAVLDVAERGAGDRLDVRELVAA